MNSSPTPNEFNNIEDRENQPDSGDPGLQRFALRLKNSMGRDILVQTELDKLRTQLQCDRVILYYLYYQWKGQVTFESSSQPIFSIYGSTGADDCFNQEYAQLYQQGRIRAISDIETAAIHPCHQNFLRSIYVRANLVVPVIVDNELWGLLIAHHCRFPHLWSASEFELLKTAAETLSTAPEILDLKR
ncbi:MULTISPECIES: GAF domain-containing protein [Planktothrix]|jgi:GAF domain-containing protein|uniref:Signal transduction histidine kinase n=3 Tax=Planktothrix TaxID=54304 RepID=A0A073CEX9_PLAA1|nr:MULTISPECIES: GAF domain-containing protein [Planktothrix]KEI66472.1 signal transduction histidine kinase [Planktothrix agardhii NIVA-CYA 126/8]MCB8760698.1 GAF domain-containing protein [Planktothrix agardhii 1813]MCB8762516.1 GAF domain-containing protein [Planktothrix agardhii 1809]MCB8763492.1 GAF domain-containing protein [Planktothrix agardhii 1809]MCB8777147.1 GAF domain-containing protein [Planktothrix agardhii 1031]